ncbi:uncharacterized protein K489DRAFT_156069 [Dissoconium aciculare CBS 342.82]|uniref:Zinc finger PHD-type domain-containing protein n=1 Tax=Dissoconium aciculare CBS 342.82 TaxID=1314786 RepID=A0A6J3MCQ0_9PEZI|nr:uncharacterized protein K489DRAFT_156069 [Dissoconium aciculare CBS 342.82]KAF1825369.1 hypothetical protein K489DRAFT_156069 [Dissoconium aciculare CBS 342.82]
MVEATTMPPLALVSSPGQSDEIPAEAEVVAFELGGRILNDHYTSTRYGQRRLQHLSRHPDYRNALNIHFKVYRDIEQVFDQHGHHKLSVQSVRRLELSSQITPLTPFPTTRNTETIDSYASYPPIEWKPGMPENWQDWQKSSIEPPATDPVHDASCDCKAKSPALGSCLEKPSRSDDADVVQNDTYYSDACDYQGGKKAVDAVADKALLPGSPTSRAPRSRLKRLISSSTTASHMNELHMHTVFTHASSLCNRPLRTEVKSYRRSRRLSCNVEPRQGQRNISQRQKKSRQRLKLPASVLKQPCPLGKQKKTSMKDLKCAIPKAGEPSDVKKDIKTVKKHVAFSLSRVDSPPEKVTLPAAVHSLNRMSPGRPKAESPTHNTENSVSKQSKLHEREEMKKFHSSHQEKLRLNRLAKALEWTKGRVKPEPELQLQFLPTISQEFGNLSTSGQSVELQSAGDGLSHSEKAVPGHTEADSRLPAKIYRSTDAAKAEARASYIDAVATGTRLPRSRQDAIAASARRHELLISQHTRPSEENTQHFRRLSARHQQQTSENEDYSRHPDLLPEFFSSANFKPRELKSSGAVRCACGAVTDDSSCFPTATASCATQTKADIVWIACETPSCGVWQHVDCMGAAVPWVARSGSRTRPTRQAAREEADGGDNLSAWTRRLDPDIKYFCHVCDPWAHRHLLAEMRKARPIVSAEGNADL